MKKKVMERGSQYLESLFADENYDVMYRMVDEGRALDPFHDDDGFPYTLLSESMFCWDIKVFRRIIRRHGTEIMHKPCMGLNETAWETLIRFAADKYNWLVKRNMSAMVEVLLDAGDPIVIAEAYKHDFFKDSYDVWWESRDAQQDTVSATVWCLKAIRANGADGLEEEVCKRMQCVSVWDYEPKIKRGRFF
jgi:hypothetical protein